MAYRYGNRRQRELLPQSIEEYVPEDAPVRAYDAFVDALDLEKLGIKINPNKVGNPEYNPPAMLKLLVYGYSYGIRSSRKLERAVNYNLSFIWLVGGLKPDFKTISEFRRNNKSALKNVLKQCARMCVKLNLIAGNTLFIDGTKIRANASIKNTWTKKKCEERLKRIGERVEAILEECEKADIEESGSPSFVELSEDLKDSENLRSKIRGILDELETEEKNQKNTTDPDCAPMRSMQGSHAAYNMQSVVDSENGLIVSADVVNENNDNGQFANQLEQAHETLEKKCSEAVADSGYSSTDDLEKVDAQDVKVVVPSHDQAIRNKKDNPFDRSHFTYDRENDCYVCPEGERLRYRYTNEAKRCKVYRGGPVCKRCVHFGRCTTYKAHGRGISRLLNADIQEKLKKQYEDNQDVYLLRKQKVELPFGHIKRNLGVSGFLLRGLEGVRAEASLFAGCFNIARMITILGVKNLILKLKEKSVTLGA